MKKIIYFLGLSLVVLSFLEGANQTQSVQKQASQFYPTPPPAVQKPLPPRPMQPIRQAGGHAPLGPITAQNIYSLPGIATAQGAQWVGNEHLFNLNPNIGFELEVISQPKIELLNEMAIKEKLAMTLRSGGLMPHPVGGGNPLPFLYFLVMLNPIEKGYVAYCSGMLLEEVQNNRIRLNPGIVWQAITWQKQELIIFPKEQLQQQIEQTLQSIAQSFADKYRSYATQQ